MAQAMAAMVGAAGVRLASDLMDHSIELMKVNLEKERIEREKEHFQLEIEWAKEDSRFRDLIMMKTQLSLLARLSALMGGFQDELIAIWAAISVLVIVVNFSIMIMASLMQLQIAQHTYKEGDFPIHDSERYSAANPDGLIIESQEFLLFWNLTCDHKFIVMMKVFSWGIPLYFASLALGVILKFYMSTVAALISAMPCVAFTRIWWHYHSGLISYITFRAAGADDDAGRYESSIKQEASLTPPQRRVPAGVTQLSGR
ncbi:hypothetical protein GUITHDRAFT_135348 [Guillardia theta CCMP2712]|uniref:Uncharacterized protein n=1 Tax=Guillardia theta (strain CCMP2712) TaxID=905079 RepID=L1JPF9_GUITC|nr:hypothetical protein GUITHDRAFT_135348 [Guillardia theta CCMP2712]EKX50164.1 hypothetical protein GUITHDRAFT_135348 [Guillardia theta CCMP2712]|eukprot:XP_005837144.1 hypothetical protein GUITHDRAFT_135348 [Guillardia theta CCMP2712]